MNGVEPSRPTSLRKIDSPRNQVLRLARSLQSKRERREQRLMVVEGEDLLDAAIAAGLMPTVAIFDEARVARDDPMFAATAGVEARYLASQALIGGVSTLAAPPRVLAIVPQPGPHHFRTVPFPPQLALFLGGVSDPGTVGSLVRTAAAFGCDWVALGPGSADAFHPRAVRAAMGATFAVPVLEGVRPGDLATREGFQVVAAAAHGGVPPWEIDLTGPLVLALGGERGGHEAMTDDLPAERTVVATIPQADGAESLNVAAAGAALLAEVIRQRAIAGDGSR